MIQRTIKTLQLSIAVLTVASIPAFAADLGTVKVNVPFAFRAGNVTLPAGNYSITENQAGLLSIEGRNGSAMVITHPGGPVTTDVASALQFEKSANGPVLKEVRVGGEPSNVLPLK